MPDSFGRMESHCFGCEGVFGGRRAEGIAERVFKDLLVKTPDKPQVYYLLAYLRNTQGRYPEALEMIRQAVKRDPDYLNAWKLMLTVGRQMRLPGADADAAALALMRLDPLGRHVQFDISEVTSLKALWETFARLQALKPSPLPEKLYPLTASAEGQEKTGSPGYSRRFYANRMRFSRYSRYRGYYSSGDEPILTPGEAVAQHGTVELTTSLVEGDLNKEGAGRGARFF
jgi:tetratricopeptide (TPR) repeat protein